MKHLLILSLLLLSTSCMPLVNLKGSYVDGPYQFTVDKPMDQVWTKIIDVMTDNGFAIKNVDKASGFITSDPHSFVGKYSYETEDGRLNYGAAYVVIPRVRNGFNITFPPTDVTGSWSIRVKEVDSKTSVSINLTNIKSFYTHTKGNYSLQGKSTGVFEKTIASELGR